MQSEVSLQASGSIKRFTPFATKLVQAAADQLAQPSIGTG
jgi:hypothetical protein